MAFATCPNCGYRLVKAKRREIIEQEPSYIFECSECGHEWSKPIL